jgi:histidinol-phosphate aminotransferase
MRLEFNPNIIPFTRQENRVSLDDIREQYGLETVYQLSQNENPLGPSPKVIEAINAVAPNLSYYPDYSDLELRQAIVEALGRDGITPEHIYTGCSGYESLELLVRSFLQAGDEVIVSSPSFVGPYQKISTLLGAKVIDVPLVPDTWAYRVDDVLNAITDKTKIIMVCNPNNPTGTVMPQDTMDALMDGVPDHVLVVSDEVYWHFVEDETYPDSMKYVLDGKNIVLIHTFSKAYGMAGLRLGYGIAKPEIADYISGLHRGFHQTMISIVAGVAAAKDQAYLKDAVDYLRAERRWVMEQFDRLDIKYWASETNFILFETPLLADDLAQKMRERGLLLRPQANNGLDYGMRVSLGTREANEAFIGALEEILGALYQ